MYGRFTQLMSWEEAYGLYRDFFDGPQQKLNLEPRYNLAPTNNAAILYANAGRRQVVKARWGLMPPWVKDLSIG